MSHRNRDEEAITRAFAQGLVVVAYRRGASIAEMMAAIPREMWSDVCEWLNERGIKTAEEYDWTTESASSFWKRNSDTVAGMCRRLSADKPVSPATQRMLELWSDGIPVVAILAILTQEGFTDEAGLHFSLETIAEAIDAYEKEQLPFVHEQAAETGEASGMTRTPSSQPGAERQGVSDPAEVGISKARDGHGPFVTPDQLRSALAATREAFGNELKLLSDSIRNELKGVLMDIARTQHPPDDLPQLPPPAPLQGLKKLGSRVKVAGTIDAELMHRLEAERKVRNISLSAMIDTVAWHYFGKPRLSFELSQDAHEET